MREFCTWVPGPEVYDVEAPSCWPGTARLGTGAAVATVMVGS